MGVPSSSFPVAALRFTRSLSDPMAPWPWPGVSRPALPVTTFSPIATDPLDTLGSEGALSPEGLASLLRLPTGCGEQTMTLLAPTLAASRYLDQTEQWSRLPPETKDHAVDLIRKGSGCRASRSGGGQSMEDGQPWQLVRG